MPSPTRSSLRPRWGNISLALVPIVLAAAATGVLAAQHRAPDGLARVKLTAAGSTVAGTAPATGQQPGAMPAAAAPATARPLRRTQQTAASSPESTDAGSDDAAAVVPVAIGDVDVDDLEAQLGSGELDDAAIAKLLAQAKTQLTADQSAKLDAAIRVISASPELNALSESLGPLDGAISLGDLDELG